jgi:hypothetical protein
MRFVALLALAGCSFVGVRAPSPKLDPSTMSADQIKCNDSSLLPSLDALGGAAAISIAGAGVILEHTTKRERYDDFTLYFAGPMLALAITYWWSASFGNNRISKCSDLKERAGATRPVILPIKDDGPRLKKTRDDDIIIH